MHCHLRTLCFTYVRSTSVGWCPVPGTRRLPHTSKAVSFVPNSIQMEEGGAFLRFFQCAERAHCPPRQSPAEPPNASVIVLGLGRIYSTRWSPVPSRRAKFPAVSPLTDVCLYIHPAGLLLLLLLPSVSPLCRLSTLIFLRQTMSLGNTVLQLF